MQKLTEIRETYVVKRKEIVNGQETIVEKQMTRYKDVRYVDGWARFGHALLDGIFYRVFTAIIGVVIGLVFVLTETGIEDNMTGLRIFDVLLNWLILHPLFYFFFEATIQATPAKAILGRIVVDEYGNKPTTKQIFIRSMARAVPFESFSCLGATGWHDDWSKTFVIRKKDLEELRLLQKIASINDQPVTSTEPQPSHPA